MNDLPEVGPLSRGAKSERLSNPLQVGFRFLWHPLPAALSVHLTVHFPDGELQAYYVSRKYHLNDLGPISTPEALHLR